MILSAHRMLLPALFLVQCLIFAPAGMAQEDVAPTGAPTEAVAEQGTQSETQVQTQPQTQAKSPEDIAQQTADLSASLTARLDQIEAALTRDSLPNTQYRELRDGLATIMEEANSFMEGLAPRLQEARAQLDTLKPSGEQEGEENGPEAETLVERRTDLEALVAELDGQTKLINANLLRADQLGDKITISRQEKFTSELFTRSTSLLSPDLWLKGLSGLAATWRTLFMLLSDWVSFLSNRMADNGWQLLGMAAFAVLIIVIPAVYLIRNNAARLSRHEHPSALQRSLHALWAVAGYMLLPASTLLAITFILNSGELLPTRMVTLANNLIFVLFAIFLAYGLIRVLLAPGNPAYRLLALHGRRARKLYGIAITILLVFAVKLLFAETSQVLLTPLETTILISGATALTIAMAVWVGLRMLITAHASHGDPQQEDHEGKSEQVGYNLPGFIKVFQPLIWLACLIIFIAPIFGYVALGSFLAEQLGRTFIILAILGILVALIDNFFVFSLDTRQPRAQKLASAMGISTRFVNQVGVLLNGLLSILLYVSAALFLFAPWGVGIDRFPQLGASGHLRDQDRRSDHLSYQHPGGFAGLCRHFGAGAPHPALDGKALDACDQPRYGP